MFKWDDSYGVGDSSLDKEHKQLFGLLDALENIGKTNDAKFIEKIIFTLEDYVQNHFKHEEEVMLQAKFPGLDDHKRQHQAFKVKLRDFRQAYERGDKQLPMSVVEYLKIWLANHILVHDKAYEPFVKKLHQQENLR